jgi:hypothetical protein
MGESTVQDTVTLDGALVDIRDCAKAHRIQSLQAETTLIDERIQTITEKAKAFREQIEEHKKIISGLKAAVSQRKSDAESANYGLNTRSAAELDTVQKSTRRIGRRWDLTHQDIVRGRISLCREAARLAGLRSIKKVEGQTMREHWEIGKSLKIFDLREMNGRIAPPSLEIMFEFSNLVRREPGSLDCFVDATGLSRFARLDLPCASTTGRDCSTAQGLSSANNILTSIFVPRSRCPLSGKHPFSFVH